MLSNILVTIEVFHRNTKQQKSFLTLAKICVVGVCGHFACIFMFSRSRMKCKPIKSVNETFSLEK